MFGLPLGRFDPLGADRVITSEETWRTDVSAFISNANYIVVSLTDAPGTQWEISEILRLEALNRTIFTFVGEDDANDEQTAVKSIGLLAKIEKGLAGAMEELAKKKGCFALCFPHGKATIFCANETKSNGYIAVLSKAKRALES